MTTPLDARPVVVVVEDENIMAFTLAQVLYSSGYAVKLFESAASFLAALPAPSPQCLVLGTDMLGMSGYELHDRLVAMDSCVPAVFVATKDTPQERMRVRKAGGFGMVSSPLNDEVLVKYVREAVNCQSHRTLGPWPPGLMAFLNCVA